MSNLLKLAKRCEQAPAERQREMLMQAYEAIHTQRPLFYDDRLLELLLAQAFVDAALTLVPPEWCLNGIGENGEGLVYGELRKTNVGDVHSTAPTLALAVAAAALRAKAIEAQRATTTEIGVVHESAVPVRHSPK